MIQVRTEPLGGVLDLVVDVHGDERGSFAELGRRSEFDALGIPPFAQMNRSVSSLGVLRGLHYQLPPTAQGKLVGVAAGRVWDVAVDLRASSDTYGEWFGVELIDSQANMLYVPPGFGHGFLTLSDRAVVIYRTTEEYDPTTERSVAHDDPDLAIEWPLVDGGPILSRRDAAAPRLTEAEVFP